MNIPFLRSRRVWLLSFFVLAGPARGLAQNEPEFSGLASLTNREVRLQLTAPAGAFCRLDASTNFSAWTALATLATNSGALEYTDSAAPFLEARFYRAEQMAGTNHLTGDHLVTSAGNVVIHPVYHASLVLSWAGPRAGAERARIRRARPADQPGDPPRVDRTGRCLLSPGCLHQPLRLDRARDLGDE